VLRRHQRRRDDDDREALLADDEAAERDLPCPEERWRQEGAQPERKVGEK
jgi:hypothetical protein